MSVNKYLPHVLILPEDDANRQVATGFLLHPEVRLRRVQILQSAGGWRSVVEEFEAVHQREMTRFHERRMVLLMDLDEESDRLEEVRGQIPEPLRQRVFLVGAWNEPEHLRREFGGFEPLGMRLAETCRDGQLADSPWGHPQLRHNEAEVLRRREHLGPILFG